jgi:hypothetical protein
VSSLLRADGFIIDIRARSLNILITHLSTISLKFDVSKTMAAPVHRQSHQTATLLLIFNGDGPPKADS